MKQEVKERIAQIQRGEVPEGYHKTKFGIVPFSWKVKTVGENIEEYRELSNDIDTHQIYSSTRKGLMPQADYYDQREAVQTSLGYKMVPTGYITYRHMSDDDVFFFNQNNIGRTILVSSEYPVFIANENAINVFLLEALNGAARFRYFCRTQKLGGTRTRLYLKNLKTYQLTMPSMEEQQKIAAILATQDKVIALKEQLLLEKRTIMESVMIQLFTRRKRANGFREQWQVKCFSELGKIVTGSTPSKDTPEYYGKDFLWITPTDIGEEKNIDFSSKMLSSAGFSKSRKLPKGTLLVTCIASIGKNAVLQKEGSCNQQINAIIPNEEYDVDFLYYYLSYHTPYIEQNAGVSATKIINKNSFSNLRRAFPPFPEQQAIAAILTTADKEVELLKKSIEAEKQKKKALMQLLLTGLVRVNNG